MAEEHLTVSSPDLQAPPGHIPVASVQVLQRKLLDVYVALDVLCRAACDPAASDALDSPTGPASRASEDPAVTAENVYRIVRGTLNQTNTPLVILAGSPEGEGVVALQGGTDL